MAGGSSATVDRVFFLFLFFLLNSLVAPFVTIIRTFQCRRVSVTLSPLSRPPNIKKKQFSFFFLGWIERKVNYDRFEFLQTVDKKFIVRSIFSKKKINGDKMSVGNVRRIRCFTISCTWNVVSGFIQISEQKRSRCL